MDIQISIRGVRFVKLILLGAPGAGKGTVAKLLTDVDGSVQISTGDILRGAVQAGTELGKQAEAFMKAGDLVPDDLIMGIMEARLQEPDCEKGFLLDGFPRTIPQAEALKSLLDKLGIKLDMAVNLDVPREVILDRLTTRRTCSNSDCQAIYNVKSNPPKQEGVCDKCGSAVIQRDDETEEAISKRLETYNEKTAPLVSFYEKEGLLTNVNATSSEVVVKSIKEQLGI
jgi:adenylate kinase